jgi:hypothetical protein
MDKRITTIALVLILFLLKEIKTSAEDLFSYEITEKTPTSITVKCTVNSDYQSYSGCSIEYNWDFFDGSKSKVTKSENEPYTEITHTYNIAGQTGYFIITISLQITEYIWWDFTLQDPVCVFSNDYFDEKTSTVFLGYATTDISVKLITSPASGFRKNTPISFSCNVTANSPQYTDLLVYSIQEVPHSIAGEAPKSGSIAQSEFGTNKPLDYTVTPTVNGLYSFKFEITRTSVSVYSQILNINVTDDGGSSSGGGTGTPECFGNCGPYGTYGVHVSSTYDLINAGYNVQFYPTHNAVPTGYPCIPENNTMSKIYAKSKKSSEAVFGNYKEFVNIAGKAPENIHPVYYYSSGNPFTYFVPMGLEEQSSDVNIWINVQDPSSGNLCMNSSQHSDYTFLEAFQLLTPTLVASDYNHLEIEALGNVVKEIPSGAINCYGLVVVNPANPIDQTESWLNIDDTKTTVQKITIDPGPNFSNTTREAELRIYDGGITNPALLTDIHGNLNNYHSIWVTQPTLLSNINYTNETIIPAPYNNPNPGATAYYGLFGGTEPLYYVSNNPGSAMPLNLLLQNVKDNSTFIIYSYDSKGNLLSQVPLKYKLSACGPTFNYTESTQYPFYIANVNAPITNMTNTINSGQCVILLAPTMIDFKTGFHAVSGSKFCATVHSCVVSTAKAATEEEAQINTGNSKPENSSETYKLLVYPNPANSLVTIQFIGTALNVQLIQVFNAMGQIVMEQSKNITEMNEFDISSYSSGLYFIKAVMPDNTVILAKFVKE